MTGQDDLIRREMRVRMATTGVTQAELARQLGVKPPAVAQVLSGQRGKIPSSLLNILAALELELAVVPRSAGRKTEEEHRGETS